MYTVPHIFFYFFALTNTLKLFIKNVGTQQRTPIHSNVPSRLNVVVSRFNHVVYCLFSETMWAIFGDNVWARTDAACFYIHVNNILSTKVFFKSHYVEFCISTCTPFLYQYEIYFCCCWKSTDRMLALQYFEVKQICYLIIYNWNFGNRTEGALLKNEQSTYETHFFFTRM